MFGMLFAGLTTPSSGGGGGGGGGGSGTPLSYGSLVEFLDAENGVTGTTSITQWTGQGSNIQFTVPSGQSSPELLSGTQNGLPGVNFAEFVGSGSLRRKLESPSAVFDNFFAGEGVKSIAFAARIDDIVNTFSTANVIASKGFIDSLGWQLEILSDGTIRFRHKRSDNTAWQIQSNGFYSQGDLVLGYLTYDGGNTSGSGSFRLYNGSDFITTGSVVTGTASGIGSDSSKNMIVGNILDTGNNNNNAAFGGPIFGLWLTKPANNIFDEGYMGRWIPSTGS